MENASNQTSGQRSGQNFITGAVILSVANVLVKIVSACFKIPITNLVGAEAMSYFNTAYTVYNALVNISTVGLSVAVAKCISEYVARGQYRNVKSVTRAAYTSFGALGFVFSLVFFLFAEPITAAMGNPNACLACRTMAPAIFFVSVLSVCRGYAQGYADMVPSAVSNVIEVVIKLVFGLGGAYLLMNLGFADRMDIVMMGAVGGVTMGAFFSMLYLLIRKRIMGKKLAAVYPITSLTPPADPYGKVFSRFIWIALPITLGSLSGNIANILDLGIVMRRLQDLPGVSESMANTLYGAYSSYAYTVFNMPAAVILSIGVSVLPAVSAAFAVKDKERLNATVNTSVKLCSLLAMPCSFGLMFMAQPILELLYSKPEEIAMAAPSLALLGAALFFMSCSSICAPLLQAVGYAWIPAVNVLIVSGVKIFFNYLLIGIPAIGINGAALSNIIMYALLFALDFIALRFITKTKGDLKSVYLLPGIGGLLCGSSAYGFYAVLSRLIPGRVATVLSIVLAAAVYLVVVLFTKIIKREDIDFLPKGKKIAVILEKHNWLG